MNLNQQQTTILDAYHRGLRPEPTLTVGQWADKYRKLPQKSSAEAGQYRTQRTPFMAEIMDELSGSSDTTTVIIQKGSQIGATEIGLNWLGYVIHKAPGPMLIVWPTVELARRNSKQRLGPMVRQEPLVDLIRDDDETSLPRAGGWKRSADTLLVKEFAGGTVQITGANSAIGLRSMPARYLFMDEVDGFPIDADGEGDPIDLAYKRTSTFKRNRKVLLVSTPTYKGQSRIESAFERSDQRYYFVPCPHCDHKQRLVWEQMTWPEDHPELARYKCIECEHEIREAQKTMMLRRGEWRSTASGAAGVVGFHLSSLYSPVGWFGWGEAATEMLDAKSRGSEAIRVWTNHVLGETWEDEGESIEPTSLLARREEYTVPRETLLVTASVDTQGDRLEVMTVGWGKGEEGWVLDHRKLFGDPAAKEVWQQLDQFLGKTYSRDDGNQFRIAAAFIDSGGHHTSAVYDYCQPRYSMGIVPIKGVGGEGRPIVSAPAKRNIKGNKRSIKLFTVGVDSVKAIVLARLGLPIGEPGSIHLPMWVDQEFVNQMTSETRMVRYKGGRPHYVWVMQYPRNEIFDLMVYNVAAMKFLNPEFDEIAKALEPTQERPPEAMEALRTKRPRQRFKDRWG